MATNAIHLTVKDSLGATLLEMTVTGHEKLYRDKAFKAFCAICFDFDMSFRHAQRADLYELIYRGWLERNGRDIRHFKLGTYTICIEH
jgi:hypothetical protein